MIKKYSIDYKVTIIKTQIYSLDEILKNELVKLKSIKKQQKIVLSVY